MWKGHTRSLQAHPRLPRFTFDICKKSNRHESSGGIGAKQGASSPCSSKNEIRDGSMPWLCSMPGKGLPVCQQMWGASGLDCGSLLPPVWINWAIKSSWRQWS